MKLSRKGCLRLLWVSGLSLFRALGRLGLKDVYGFGLSKVYDYAILN